MKQVNLENVQEAGSFEKLPVGGYICKYVNVEDIEKKEYLYMEFDIAEGEFKDYYKDLYDSRNFWGGNLYRSYKDTAAGMFKAFTTAVEASNPRYTWDWNERGLINKLVGIVLQEEEYIPTQGENAGKVKTRLIVSDIKSVEEIRMGKFKVKDKKTLSPNSSSATTAPIQTFYDNNTFDVVPQQSFDIKDDDLQF